jgi:hypothetical protein
LTWINILAWILEDLDMAEAEQDTSGHERHPNQTHDLIRQLGLSPAQPGAVIAKVDPCIRRPPPAQPDMILI